MSSVAHSGSNIIMKTRKKTSAFNNGFERIVLTRVASFMESLQLLQNNLSTCTYNSFEVLAPSTIHFRFTKAFDGCTFTYLELYAIHSHRRVAVYESRAPSKCQTSLLRGMITILVVMEQNLSFSEPRLNFSTKQSSFQAKNNFPIGWDEA